MERWHRPGLWAALSTAALVRFWRGGAESLWLDELFSVRAATREDLASLVQEVRADVHPPLFYLLLRGWIGLFGDADAALRGLPALLGVATVGAVFLLGRRLYTPAVGLGAAWLLAVAPFAVDLDREVRANGLMALLSVLATWALARREARGSLVLYAVFLGLLGWTHSFGLLVVAGHAFWMIGEAAAGAAGRADLRRWLQALIAGLLLVAPWAPALLAQSTAFGAHPWYAPPAPDALAWLLPTLLGGAGPACVLLLGVVLLYARGESGPGGRLLPAMVLGLVFVAQAVSLTVAPVLRDRNVLALLPILVVGGAAGLARVSGVGAGLIGLGVVISGFVTLGNLTQLRKEDWRGAAAVVQRGWSEGDRVDANFTPLWEHYLPEVWGGGEPGGRVWVVRAHEDLVTTGDPATGELVQEWWSPGTHVVLRDPSVRRVELGADMGPPMWDGTRLNYYWNQSVRSAVLPLGGACAIGLVGSAEEVDGVGAELVVRLIVDGVAVATWRMVLPGEQTAWWSPATTTGPAAIEVEFTNDGPGTNASGGPGDRNAHLDRVLVRCR